MDTQEPITPPNQEVFLQEEIDKLDNDIIQRLEVSLSITDKLLIAKNEQVKLYNKNWELQLQSIHKRLDKAARLIENANVAIERLRNQMLVYK